MISNVADRMNDIIGKTNELNLSLVGAPTRLPVQTEQWIPTDSIQFEFIPSINTRINLLAKEVRDKIAENK